MRLRAAGALHEYKSNIALLPTEKSLQPDLGGILWWITKIFRTFHL